MRQYDHSLLLGIVVLCHLLFYLHLNLIQVTQCTPQDAYSTQVGIVVMHHFPIDHIHLRSTSSNAVHTSKRPFSTDWNSGVAPSSRTWFTFASFLSSSLQKLR